MVLSNKQITEEIRGHKIPDHCENMIQNLWDTAKAIQRGKFIARWWGRRDISIYI